MKDKIRKPETGNQKPVTIPACREETRNQKPSSKMNNGQRTGMQLLKHIVMVLYIGIFLNCSFFRDKSTKIEPFVGTYMRGHPLSAEIIKLKSDSTFIYHHSSDPILSRVEGFWRIQKDTIYLDDHHRIEYLSVINTVELFKPNENLTTFRFLDKNDKDLRLHIELFINNRPSKLYENKYIHGYSKYNNTPLYAFKEIVLDSLDSANGINQVQFRIGDLVFDYEMNYSASNYVIFYFNQAEHEIEIARKFRNKRKWLYLEDKICLFKEKTQYIENTCFYQRL